MEDFDFDLADDDILPSAVELRSYSSSTQEISQASKENIPFGGTPNDNEKNRLKTSHFFTTPNNGLATKFTPSPANSDFFNLSSSTTIPVRSQDSHTLQNRVSNLTVAANFIKPVTKTSRECTSPKLVAPAFKRTKSSTTVSAVAASNPQSCTTITPTDSVTESIDSTKQKDKPLIPTLPLSNPSPHSSLSYDDQQGLPFKSTTPQKVNDTLPGPVGSIPDLPADFVFSKEKLKSLEQTQFTSSQSSQAENRPFHIHKQASSTQLFTSPSWLTMLSDCNLPPAPQATEQLGFNIKRIRETRLLEKVPRLAAVVDSISFKLHVTCIVVAFKDPTGCIQGSVDYRIKEKYAKEFSVGSTVLLKNVSIFRPIRESAYLNIAITNVEAIWSVALPQPAWAEDLICTLTMNRILDIYSAKIPMLSEQFMRRKKRKLGKTTHNITSIQAAPPVSSKQAVSKSYSRTPVPSYDQEHTKRTTIPSSLSTPLHTQTAVTVVGKNYKQPTFAMLPRPAPSVSKPTHQIPEATTILSNNTQDTTKTKLIQFRRDTHNQHAMPPCPTQYVSKPNQIPEATTKSFHSNQDSTKAKLNQFRRNTQSSSQSSHRTSTNCSNPSAQPHTTQATSSLALKSSSFNKKEQLSSQYCGLMDDGFDDILSGIDDGEFRISKTFD